MAQTETKTDTRLRVYGNFRTPTSKGLAGLSTAGTVLLIGGVVGGIVLMMLNLWLVALGFEAVILTLIVLSMQKNKHGRTLIERIMRRAGWANARYSGATVYRAGPVSRVPGGTTKLPGISARSKITEHVDGAAAIHRSSTATDSGPSCRQAMEAAAATSSPTASTAERTARTVPPSTETLIRVRG